MLAKRVIPCLDVRDGKVVKSVRFVDTKDVGDAIELARRYNDDGADELVFLDINASHEQRRTVVDFASRVAEQLFIPFTVGGGIRTLDDATRLIQAGAEKVSINSAAVKNPNLIIEVARKFGRCATVVNIDPRRVTTDDREVWEVHINGGRVPTGRDVVAWAVEAVDLGAGEILLNSIDRDGTKLGFDLAMTAAVAAAVNVPVIASGGASSAADFVTLFRETGADAGLAASIFHYGELSVGDVKAALAAAGVPVRPRERVFA